MTVVVFVFSRVSGVALPMAASVYEFTAWDKITTESCEMIFMMHREGGLPTLAKIQSNALADE